MYCSGEGYALKSLIMIGKICWQYFVRFKNLLLNHAIAILLHILQCIYVTQNSWGEYLTEKLASNMEDLYQIMKDGSVFVLPALRKLHGLCQLLHLRWSKGDQTS